MDEFVNKIRSVGGAVAIPNMPIPGLAWLAYCKDPDGNTFGIYEDDKNAK